MKQSRRMRLGFFLERFEFLHPFILVIDGPAPNGKLRCINKINGHVVVK